MKIQLLRWRDFQHYKRRSPPWIRLYRKLIDDREYRRMTGDARALLVDLWMLASETADGLLECSPEDMAWRLRIPEDDMLLGLQEIAAVLDKDGEAKWFTWDARSALSPRVHDATPETEAETETEESSAPTGAVGSGWSRQAVDSARAVALQYQPGRVTRILKPFVERDGSEVALAHWREFLKVGRYFDEGGKYLDNPGPMTLLRPERFRDTYDEWKPSTRKTA